MSCFAVGNDRNGSQDAVATPRQQGKARARLRFVLGLRQDAPADSDNSIGSEDHGFWVTRCNHGCFGRSKAHCVHARQFAR